MERSAGTRGRARGGERESSFVVLALCSLPLQKERNTEERDRLMDCEEETKENLLHYLLYIRSKFFPL